MATTELVGSHAADSAEAARVVTRALVRASGRIGLTQREVAPILGVSPASLSRVHGGLRLLDMTGKEGELALLFLRVYRSLDTLVGGDDAHAQAWIRSENAHLGGVPLLLMARIQGLVDVAGYLDGMRGRG